jgi:hypothetical protein
MATSEVEIANSALLKCGVDRIISLDESNNRAEAMKEQFYKHRDALMRSHPWNWAIKRVELAEVSETPAFDFTNTYQLPTDCLRVLKINELLVSMNGRGLNLNNYGEFSIEGDKLLCNFSTVKIKYIAKITDVSKWDENFCEVLAFRLAADLAYRLTGSAALATALYEQYEKELRQARSFDGQEGSSDRVVESPGWLVSRF